MRSKAAIYTNIISSLPACCDQAGDPTTVEDLSRRQQLQAAPPAVLPSQERSSNEKVIEMPLTAEAAVRLWRSMADELSMKVAEKHNRADLRNDLESVGIEALWHAWASYDRERKCSWVGWATHRVTWAMNHWLDKEIHPRRKNQVVMVELDPGVEDGTPWVDDLVDKIIQREEIHAAVQDLSSRQQQIIEIVYSDGMTVTAAGDELRVSRTTASTELRTALASIRARLKIE